MIRSLVAVSPDIEASIALRFACELAHFCEMSIQAIYAKEPDVPRTFSEIGWARRTWEREMTEKFEKEIGKLVATESRFCPVAISPIVTTGDKEKVILERLKTGKYDIFIEGAVSGDPRIIEERINSKLYSNATVPIVLVRNLLRIREVILVLEDDVIEKSCLDLLDQIFQKKDITINLCFLKDIKGSLDDLISVKTLADKGFSVGKRYNALSDDLPTECSLVVCSVDRKKGDVKKLINVLVKIDAPVLFIWLD